MKIFFDLDGTLIDISQRHYQVYKSAVVKFDGEPLPQKRYWQLKRDNTQWSELLKYSRIALKHESDFMTHFTHNIESQDMLSLDNLFAQSREVLKNLQKNHELILVSLRRNPRNLRLQLEKLGLTQYFKHILSGHSDTKEGVLTKKATVIQELGQLGQACIIGDTEADISAGKQLGIPSIALTTGIRSKEFLAKLNPDYSADSIDDVQSIIGSIT